MRLTTYTRNVGKIATAILAAAAARAALADTSASTNTPAAPGTPPPTWNSSATVGLTLTRGNSDSTTLSAGVASEKKWDANILDLGGDGLYGTAKNHGSSTTTKNAETLHGFSQYNRLFTERFYGYARLDVLHDAIAAIRYRVTLSPGAGYYFIKEKTIDLSGEVGPGYVTEHLGSRYLNYATLRVGEKFNWKFTDKARLWQTAEILPQVDYMKNYIVNFEIGVEVDMTKKLSLKTFFDDTYNNVPAPGFKKNDAKLVSAIGYKF